MPQESSIPLNDGDLSRIPTDQPYPALREDVFQALAKRGEVKPHAMQPDGMFMLEDGRHFGSGY